MATTTETYRIGARNPRYTTKLSTFANGMYLTEQVLPEGYAKVLVNYDIADTGSNIHPKYGRSVYQTLEFNSEWLGALTLTDYLYEYDKETNEVTEIQDTLISLGSITNLVNLGANPSEVENNDDFYLCSLQTNDKVLSPGWALVFNEDTSHFDTASTSTIGGVSARVLKNTYQHSVAVSNVLADFNKETFKNTVYRPIYTVLDNELYAFTYGDIVRNISEAGAITISRESYPSLSKLKIVNTSGQHSFVREVINPKRLNPIEAGNAGFNILSREPYSFEDEANMDVSITGLIPYSDESWTKPNLIYNVGTEILFRAFYSYGSVNDDFQYKIEYAAGLESTDQTTTDSYKLLQDWTKLDISKNNDPDAEPAIIKFKYTPDQAFTRVRVSARKGTDDATVRTMEFPVDTTYEDTGADEFKVYDLYRAKGMFSWKGYLGLYGVPGMESTLIFSAPGDPSYFPFPMNKISFDNNVLAVYNYLDNLLVVTVDGIWLVQLGASVSASIQTRVLSNIFISELDALNIQILKDEIFFKTDNQFYVLKPNKYTADSTNLKSYSNSTAVAELTKNFKVEILKILNDTYRHLFRRVQQEQYVDVDGCFTDFTIQDVYSVLRNEEVFYTYLITPNFQTRLEINGDLINQTYGDQLQISLIYNTVSRAWRMYMEGVGDTVNTAYCPLLYKGKQTGSFYQVFAHTDKVTLAKQDKEIQSNRIDVDDWTAGSVYENYQFINTGSIAVDDTFTKRFREVQFNILNREKIQLDFKTEFLLDGQTRIDYTNYLVQHITDENDPDYGRIFVTPIEEDNMFVAGKTSLDFWNIDFSKFPELAVTTVRFQLQGRGRRGQLKLLCTALKDYELADINWVYRIMSAR